MRRLSRAPSMSPSSCACESVGDQTRSRPSPGWTDRCAKSALNTCAIAARSAGLVATTRKSRRVEEYSLAGLAGLMTAVDPSTRRVFWWVYSNDGDDQTALTP